MKNVVVTVTGWGPDPFRLRATLSEDKKTISVTHGVFVLKTDGKYQSVDRPAAFATIDREVMP